MTSFRHLLPAALALLTASVSAAAQDNLPRIGYVYPAGGRQGASVEVTLGGRSLVNASAVRLTGPGVSAVIVDQVKIPNGKELNDLRETFQQLQARFRASRGQPPRPASRPASGPAPASAPASRPEWTPEDAKRLEDIRRLLALVQKRRLNPALAETVVVRIAIDPNAPAGPRELRLLTANGLSNPLAFCVGAIPEYRETESELITARTETGLTLPVVINGQCAPGDIDRFRFHASKGQRLLVAAAARELIPYISDAVPGWFQAVLALYDANGRELAYADHFRFHHDPVLFCTIPADGDYVVEIRDSLYRGRDDFVYRITLGELPFLTALFPLGGRAGSTTPVHLTGWNLPADRLSPAFTVPGVHPLTIGRGPGVSNALPFAACELPEILEKEPNDQPGSAQPVGPPVVLNGRIDRPGDRDCIRFEGHAGEKIVAEVLARRLDSPLDSALRLTNEAGRQLAFNDDHEDKAAALDTHHADSYIAVTLPADGTYTLHLTDAQGKGGPEYAYRLRLGAPRPDFALRAAPSGLTIRRGGSAALTVHALRTDGFAGEIALALKNPPAGFKLAGPRVPAGQDSVRVTLTAPQSARDEPVRIEIEGRAVINGRPVVHPATPAEDMQQAFSYRHLVPADELLVMVTGRGRAMGGAKILTETPAKIPPGGAVAVRVAIPANVGQGAIHLELTDPPPGITIQKVSPFAGGTELLLRADPQKAKPGHEGTLIVNVFLQRSAPASTPATASAPAKPQPGRRVPLGTLPAIPYRVIAR